MQHRCRCDLADGELVDLDGVAEQPTGVAAEIVGRRGVDLAFRPYRVHLVHGGRQADSVHFHPYGGVPLMLGAETWQGLLHNGLKLQAQDELNIPERQLVLRIDPELF